MAPTIPLSSVGMYPYRCTFFYHTKCIQNACAVEKKNDCARSDFDSCSTLMSEILIYQKCTTRFFFRQLHEMVFRNQPTTSFAVGMHRRADLYISIATGKGYRKVKILLPTDDWERRTS